MDLKTYVRTVPDFPKKGVMFRDITTIFNNASAFAEMVNQFQSAWNNYQIEAIAGIDARGFVVGGALAYKMQLPFIALRKAGKLPFKTISEEYDLEYGKAKLEIHKDALKANQNVLIVDDLIATGGTAAAGVNLIRAVGGTVVGCGFIIDLPAIGGAERLKSTGVEVKSLMVFEEN